MIEILSVGDLSNTVPYSTLSSPQDQLDNVRDVMPLRNQDLVMLVGRTCAAVVYDSERSS